MESKTTNRENIRSILESLNQSKYFTRKGSPSIRIDDGIIESIYDALKAYHDLATTEKYFSERKDRIDRLSAVIKAGAKFKKTLNLSIKKEDVTFHREAYDLTIPNLNRLLAQYKSAFDYESQNKTPANQIRAEKRKYFIDDMADIYETATGRTPGKDGGPFLYFVKAFLNEPELTMKTAIRKVLSVR